MIGGTKYEFGETEEIIMDEDSDEELEDNDYSSSDEDTTPEEVESRFRPSRPDDSPKILKFKPSVIGLNKTLYPNINAASSSFDIFNLFFEEVFHIILEETNRYFHQFIAKRNIPSTSVGPDEVSPDISLEELYKFFALIIQMAHNQRDTFEDYWNKDVPYYTPFYHNTMSRERFLHILRFIHFNNNYSSNQKDDTLWKIRSIFDKLNKKYTEVYYPTEHLVIKELMVLYKGKVTFRHYIPKKNKRFKLKIYKICDSLGYTLNMAVHLKKQSAINETVMQLTQEVKSTGHKLYMDSYFSSPLLFDDLLDRKINSCGTISQNRYGIPKDVGLMKLKRGEIVTRVQRNLCLIRWKDKQDMFILTNMHAPPPEDRLLDEFGNAIKPLVVEDYNKHMGYVEKSVKMTNCYGVAKKSWKWTKKLFFHLLEVTICNAYILHKSVGGKMTHKKFRESLVRDLIFQSHETNVKSSEQNAGRSSLTTGSLSRLEMKHSKHWPAKGKGIRRCRMCSVGQKLKRTLYYCQKCDVGLCIVDCFAKWHTSGQL